MTLDGTSGTGQVTARAGFLTAAGLAMAVAVTTGFARFAYALILPAMRNDLGWNYTEAGWNNTANAIGYLAGAVVVFRAVRHIGPHRLFAANLWVTAAALTLRISKSPDVNPTSTCNPMEALRYAYMSPCAYHPLMPTPPEMPSHVVALE